MKKTFEYDLTKYSPDAPTRTEEFLTADGVKTLTTDANDGAVLLQDEVDGDSLNPVTGAAVAAAIEAGGGGGGTEYSAGDGISIAEDTISAKVDGTTIGVNASGELEALGGGGSTLEAGQGINIQNDKINVRVDNNSIQIKSDTVISTDNDYTYDYRNIDLWNMTSGTKCDWVFGSDSTAFDITATAAQAGCQIRAALYDGNGVRISVSSKYFIYWGMPKTLVEGTNSFNGGWQWTSQVRPSGATFATEFPLPEGRSYEDVATIALVAYDATNSQVVGDPLPFTHNSNIQFKMETDANSKLSVVNPLPDSSGASQGDVLTVGSSGPEWGSAGGGGAGVEFVTRNNTFEEVFEKYDEGKLVVLMYPINANTTFFYAMTRYCSNDGHYLYPGVFLFSRWTRSSKSSYAGYTEVGNFSTDQWSCGRDGNGTTQWTQHVEKVIPDYDNSDAGKVLQVQSGGTLAWVTLS